MDNLTRHETPSASGDFRRLAGVVFAPLTDYGRALAASAQPEALAEEIRSRRLRLDGLATATIGAIAVATFAGRVLGFEAGTLDLVEIPFLNDIAVLLWFGFAAFLGTVVTQPLLRRFGGTARFSDTMTANAHLAIVYAPMLAVASAVMIMALGLPEDPELWTSADAQIARLLLQVVTFVPAAHSVVVMARLHGLSVARTVGAVALAGLVASLAVATLALVGFVIFGLIG